MFMGFLTAIGIWSPLSPVLEEQVLGLFSFFEGRKNKQWYKQKQKPPNKNLHYFQTKWTSGSSGFQLI